MSIVPTMKYAVKVEGSSLVVTGEFKPGEKYRIRLFPGIEGSRANPAQQADLMWDVRISDRIPAVEFVNAGMYLYQQQPEDCFPQHERGAHQAAGQAST